MNTKETSDSSLTKILTLVNGSGAQINKKIPALEVKNYTKKFGKFVATEHVNFTVNHGVIHGFIGPNGSGKTTTIKTMIGAYVATDGKITINGHKAGSVNANKLIGYIPERASFPKHLNSEQYLSAMGELSGLKPKMAKLRARKILQALKMEKQAKRKPITFSSGMQKKILLAQSLLTDPSILILDEPAANLDPTTRKELFDQLIMLRDQGKTILISSHILAELERIIDEATFIYYGEVVWTGHVADFAKLTSDVYIKASDNKALESFLTANNYLVKGDVKTEVIVPNLSPIKSKRLFHKIAQSDIKILSFRANDLQGIYDKLSQEAYLKNRGKQTLKGHSVVKNKKGSA